uniref:Ig heavy chain V-II region SESS n=1 Tax=Fundulus heteroclitus TaxID=8078 RepID=A0A146ZXF0_FUNHE
MVLQILTRVLLLSTLLQTGVRSLKDTVFVYSRLRGEALLPCTKLTTPDCSGITWTFFKGGQVRYTEEIIGGRVNSNSDKSSRTTITSNCSLVLRDLIVEDAGSYVCLENQIAVSDVYLSLLSIRSTSPITELQPGGILTMTCILFTYYDAGSCKPYSTTFRIHWLDEDGKQLPKDHQRYNQTENTRCNITLVTKLQMEDNNRKWRCQVDTMEDKKATFLDFKSSFLFQTDQTVQPSVTEDCPAELPVSRIVLCVLLPLMVCVVGFFTWKSDQKRAKTSAGVIELRDIY